MDPRGREHDRTRADFFTKLREFRQLQLLHMPGILVIALAAPGYNPEPVHAVEVKLWLPSELLSAQRQAACLPGLAGAEAHARELQKAVARISIQHHLAAQQRLMDQRNKTITGNKKSAAARALILRHEFRYNLSAQRAGQAERAIVALT